MSTKKRLTDVLRGLSGMGKGDPKAWAKRLQEVDQRGGVLPMCRLRPHPEGYRRLTVAQREMYRAALRVGQGSGIEGEG